MAQHWNIIQDFAGGNQCQIISNYEKTNKMITKEEYLKALKIVEEYHYQLKQEIVNHKPKLNDIGLKRGDFVVYVGGSESQYLTKNMKYRLTREPRGNKIVIKNDKGNRMVTNQSFFKTYKKLNK